MKCGNEIKEIEKRHTQTQFFFAFEKIVSDKSTTSIESKTDFTAFFVRRRKTAKKMEDLQPKSSWNNTQIPMSLKKKT